MGIDVFSKLGRPLDKNRDALLPGRGAFVAADILSKPEKVGSMNIAASLINLYSLGIIARSAVVKELHFHPILLL